MAIHVFSGWSLTREKGTVYFAPFSARFSGQNEGFQKSSLNRLQAPSGLTRDSCEHFFQIPSGTVSGCTRCRQGPRCFEIDQAEELRGES